MAAVPPIEHNNISNVINDDYDTSSVDSNHTEDSLQQQGKSRRHRRRRTRRRRRQDHARDIDNSDSDDHDSDDDSDDNDVERGKPRDDDGEQTPGLLIAPHHVVLRITEPDSNYKETKATITLHEIYGEFQGQEPFPAETILASVLETVRIENPSIGGDTDLILIECTPEVRQKQLVYDAAPTHCLSPQQPPQYAVASQPAQALEYYHSLWSKRIPRQEAERRAWVAEIEDQFCAWQLTPVARFQSNEKIENLRLAIQFVKKWMAEPEAGVTEQMLPGHLKLIQRGWNELKDATMPSEEEQQAAAQAEEDAAAHAQVPDFKYPREYFQTLPTDKVNRLVYVRRIKHNYHQWKDTIVARQFRKNILLAFEKLMQHTEEWLGYTNTDKSITESTLKMFFGLLKERWNEFLDKTEKYSPLLAKRPERDDDDDEENGDAPVKRARTTPLMEGCVSDEDEEHFVIVDTVVAVESTMLDAKPAAKSDPNKLPVLELEWRALDDEEYSQVSLPFAKSIDPNPLRSDATKGLFGAVEQNDLSQVQHFFAQGASSNLCDEFGETPLHRAAAIGNEAILQHLRLWSADPNIRNSAGELPVHVAAWYGHPNAVTFFLRQLKATSLSSLVDSRGRTPMHHACQQGHMAVVRVLVESFRHEHVIDMVDQDRLSPRHYALMGGQAEMVQFLDGLGAKRETSFDPTSLFDACSTGRLGLVKCMVESYADLSVKDKQGRTPLDCARQAGQTEVVEWIEACLAI